METWKLINYASSTGSRDDLKASPFMNVQAKVGCPQLKLHLWRNLPPLSPALSQPFVATEIRLFFLFFFTPKMLNTQESTTPLFYGHDLLRCAAPLVSLSHILPGLKDSLLPSGTVSETAVKFWASVSPESKRLFLAQFGDITVDQLLKLPAFFSCLSPASGRRQRQTPCVFGRLEVFQEVYLIGVW